VRTDDDSWDITESVGATALGVAAARAAETESDHPLISDPFARVFLDTAGDGEWNWFGAPELPAEVVEAEPALPLRMKSMVSYFASRTLFFDTLFLDAANAGIRQVVILAAGLDSRAYRLDWPSGTTVFEIDQPRVLAYKAATLDAHGAVPVAKRRAVPVDLRDDWPAALIDAGFRPHVATTWLAEGLLPYLPADAQDRLFQMVTALSAPGSRIAVEAFESPRSRSEEQRAAWRERTERLRIQLGLDNDFEALIYQEPHRADAAALLADHGWRVHGVDSREEMARLGRPVPDDLAEDSVASTLLSARLAA
jgi:methyltransferase (TIGR00027 family)